MFGKMTIKRMDNVGIVVEDLKAAIAFFVELGMELEGEATVEGPWVDNVVGLKNVQSDIAMLRTPDGHSRLELSRIRKPMPVRGKPENPMINTLGLHRVMFTVDDIKDVVKRLRRHGAKLIGKVERYEDIYLLCYIRGPQGIIIGLAQELK